MNSGPDAIDDLPIPGSLPSLRMDELRRASTDSPSYLGEVAELDHASTGLLGFPALSENNVSLSQLSNGNAEDMVRDALFSSF